jgi:hypothetical protein
MQILRTLRREARGQQNRFACLAGGIFLCDKKKTVGPKCSKAYDPELANVNPQPFSHGEADEWFVEHELGAPRLSG